MTLDKAIETLQYLIKYCTPEEQEALKMAVEIILSVQRKDD